MFVKKTIFYFLPLIFTSCCTFGLINDSTNISTSKEETMLQDVRKSVVRVLVKTELYILDKTTSSSIAQDAKIHSGSGSIVRHTQQSSFILTAAHVCDVISENQILFSFPYFKKDWHNVYTKNQFILIDINGKKQEAYELFLVKEFDTCVLVTMRMEHVPLFLSNDKINDSQRAYLLGFPYGIQDINLVPIFSGFYSGTLEKYSGYSVNLFTIFAFPGVSGGPVIDENGKIISMIHSYVSRSNIMSLAATQKQIKQTLEVAEQLYFSKGLK